MPREGIAYHVDDDWRARVRARLLAKKLTPAQWAKDAGCSKSLVSELLSGKRKQTTYLPELHESLGWDPPQPPLPSKDGGEIAFLWDRLDERAREDLIAKARQHLDRILIEARGAKPDGAKKKS